MNGMLQGLTESFKTVLFRHALFSLGSVALVVFVRGGSGGHLGRRLYLGLYRYVSDVPRRSQGNGPGG